MQNKILESKDYLDLLLKYNNNELSDNEAVKLITLLLLVVTQT